jgi:hypothetical protein
MIASLILSTLLQLAQPEIRITDEADRLKVQIQLLLEENASLRRQLAQVDEKAVRDAGKQLLEALARKYGAKPEDYELRIDPETNEMKFVMKRKGDLK